MAQFSVKIMRLTGSVLGENQHYVAMNNLNTATLSLLAARGSFRRASMGYIVSIVFMITALTIIWKHSTMSLTFIMGLLTSISLLTFAANNLLSFIGSPKQGLAEPMCAPIWDQRFFATAFKINLSGTFFQASVLFSLNWLSTHGTSGDLAQVSFASQIFNQFGFMGIVFYPFFLRARAAGGQDRVLLQRWTVLIGMFGIVVVGIAVVAVLWSRSACEAGGCFGLSGASGLSIVAGAVIGALIVARSPIAWILQLNKLAGIEVVSHALAGFILAAPVLIWSHAETVLGMRVAAQLLLIALPTFIFISKIRNGTLQ